MNHEPSRIFSDPFDERTSPGLRRTILAVLATFAALGLAGWVALAARKAGWI